MRWFVWKIDSLREAPILLACNSSPLPSPPKLRPLFCLASQNLLLNVLPAVFDILTNFVVVLLNFLMRLTLLKSYFAPIEAAKIIRVRWCSVRRICSSKRVRQALIHETFLKICEKNESFWWNKNISSRRPFFWDPMTDTTKG